MNEGVSTEALGNRFSMLFFFTHTAQLRTPLRILKSLSPEGEQNIPPQNMLLWGKGYFEIILIIFKKQQAQEKLLKPSRSYPL